MIIDNAQHDDQRDNNIHPYRTCFPTCVAMCLRTIDPVLRLNSKLDDFIIAEVENNLTRYKKAILKIGQWTKAYHPRTIYKFWELVFFPFHGYKAKYKSWTFQEIKSYLDHIRRPVIIGTKATGAGHVVMIVGYTHDSFMVNDPYGNALSSYNDTDGEQVVYPFSGKIWNKKIVKEKTKFNCLVII